MANVARWIIGFALIVAGAFVFVDASVLLSLPLLAAGAILILFFSGPYGGAGAGG